MKIDHNECLFIYLKDNKIILKKDIDLLDIDNFSIIQKELDFLKKIRSRINNYVFFNKNSQDFLYYPKELREYAKKYLNDYGYNKINLMEYYDNKLKKISISSEDYVPFMNWKSIYELFEAFEIIKNNQVVRLEKDLIEPTIEF